MDDVSSHGPGVVTENIASGSTAPSAPTSVDVDGNALQLTSEAVPAPSNLKKVTQSLAPK